MRTTLNLEDDVLDFAKSVAAFRRISIGQAVSELARKGMRSRVGTCRDPVSGLLVFDVPPDAPQITSDDVQRALDAADVEEFAKYFQKP